MVLLEGEFYPNFRVHLTEEGALKATIRTNKNSIVMLRDEIAEREKLLTELESPQAVTCNG
jgi:hypothetical protein